MKHLAQRRQLAIDGARCGLLVTAAVPKSGHMLPWDNRAGFPAEVRTFIEGDGR
jgi:hypothetical protein